MTDERLTMTTQEQLEAMAQAAGITVDQLTAAILILRSVYRNPRPERACA